MTLNSERGAPSLGHLEKAGDGRGGVWAGERGDTLAS